MTEITDILPPDDKPPLYPPITDRAAITPAALARLQRDNLRLQMLVDHAYPALLIARGLLAELSRSSETINKAIAEIEAGKP